MQDKGDCQGERNVERGVWQDLHCQACQKWLSHRHPWQPCYYPWSSELAEPPGRDSYLTTSHTEKWEHGYQSAAGVWKDSHLGWRKGADTTVVKPGCLGIQGMGYSRTVSISWATPASPLPHSPAQGLHLTTLAPEELSPLSPLGFLPRLLHILL